MSKVIVCIHGRSNKPEEKILTKWWKKSIKEGLSINVSDNIDGIDFKMAYYANIYYKKSDNDTKEPYKPGNNIKRYRLGWKDRIRAKFGDWIDSPVDWLEEHSSVFSKLAKKVSKKLLKDLGEYYSKPEIRNEIKGRLKTILLDHKDDEIILISHSMGTIVAYELLRELGRDNEHKGFSVEHFITMGSPLGLTAVQGDILKNQFSKLRTPSCVNRSWVNFSDPDDVVCLDSHLADDYDANSASVHVRDVMVCNDYPDNEHKSYGYLRTPEFSEHLSRIT